MILLNIQEFGFAFRENEYNRVVEIQDRLRKKGLLRNLSKKSLKVPINSRYRRSNHTT